MGKKIFDMGKNLEWLTFPNKILCVPDDQVCSILRDAEKRINKMFKILNISGDVADAAEALEHKHGVRR